MADTLKQRPGDQPLPQPNGCGDIQTLVINDIGARRDVGISRYGTALQPFNGRDSLRDAYEEAMDLTIYLRQVMEERDDVAGVAAVQQRLADYRLHVRRTGDLIAELGRQLKPIGRQVAVQRDGALAELVALAVRLVELGGELADREPA